MPFPRAEAVDRPMPGHHPQPGGPGDLRPKPLLADAAKGFQKGFLEDIVGLVADPPKGPLEPAEQVGPVCGERLGQFGFQPSQIAGHAGASGLAGAGRLRGRNLLRRGSHPGPQAGRLRP